MEIITHEYKDWVVELKQRIRQSQIKAAVRVNTELLQLYWQMGSENRAQLVPQLAETY